MVTLTFLRGLLADWRDVADWQYQYAESWAKQRTAHSAPDRGQTNLVGLYIGLMVAAIVAVSVFIPVVSDATASANVTGNTQTILDLLPLFAALLLLIALAAPLMRRV